MSRRFKIIKDGVLTNSWTDEVNGDGKIVDETYWEPSFGEPGSYQLVIEDMSAEIAAKAADDADRAQVGAFLKNLKKSDLVDVNACAAAIMKIVKHLRADR